MNIIDQLKRDEGLRLTPYKDPVGKLTIGYGHNLDAKGISREVAEEILQEDAIQAAADVARELPWAKQMSEEREAVLINMAFNMGIVGLLEFHQTLALIQAGQYAQAAEEMLRSKWARQVGNRATRLAVQLSTGLWT